VILAAFLAAFLLAGIAFSVGYVVGSYRVEREWWSVEAQRHRVKLGRRRLPPAAVNGCDHCTAEPGERHAYLCRAIPATWFTANNVTSADGDTR
jgi:hypothetical protein